MKSHCISMKLNRVVHQYTITLSQTDYRLITSVFQPPTWPTGNQFLNFYSGFISSFMNFTPYFFLTNDVLKYFLAYSINVSQKRLLQIFYVRPKLRPYVLLWNIWLQQYDFVLYALPKYEVPWWLLLSAETCCFLDNLNKLLCID